MILALPLIQPLQGWAFSLFTQGRRCCANPGLNYHNPFRVAEVDRAMELHRQLRSQMEFGNEGQCGGPLQNHPSMQIVERGKNEPDNREKTEVEGTHRRHPQVNSQSLNEEYTDEDHMQRTGEQETFCRSRNRNQPAHGLGCHERTDQRHDENENKIKSAEWLHKPGPICRSSKTYV
jgi:hypothetical protein